MPMRCAIAHRPWPPHPDIAHAHFKLCLLLDRRCLPSGHSLTQSESHVCAADHRPARLGRWFGVGVRTFELAKHSKWSSTSSARHHTQRAQRLTSRRGARALHTGSTTERRTAGSCSTHAPPGNPPRVSLRRPRRPRRPRVSLSTHHSLCARFPATPGRDCRDIHTCTHGSAHFPARRKHARRPPFLHSSTHHLNIAIATHCRRTSKPS